MNSAECYGNAVKTAEIAVKMVQFYILTCVAVAGWIMTTDAISGTEPLSYVRIAVCLVFTVSSIALIGNAQRALKTTNSLLDLSLKQFEAERLELGASEDR